MRKVKQDFFCIKEKKSYKKGEEYTGSRDDLDHVLEKEVKNKKAPQSKKKAISKK